MTDLKTVLGYIAVMAITTYLIRMLPLVIFRKKINNRFIKSFLYYIPYAVLAAMTIPSIFYSTAGVWSALAGLLVALVLAFFEQGLVTVALVSALAVFIVELIQKFI